MINFAKKEDNIYHTAKTFKVSRTSVLKWLKEDEEGSLLAKYILTNKAGKQITIEEIKEFYSNTG